jgi:iron complex outermembrane receptor protein
LRSFLSLFLLAYPVVAQPPADPPDRPAPATRHDTVVVTGSFEPLSLDEVDRAIALVPVRANTLVLNTLVDALRADPSLDLQERAPNGVQTDLSIRGGTSAQTLVLLDGLRLSDAQTGHHAMDIPVPLDSIQQVEVLRGSGSTLYGSDAIGGVINVITAPPEDMELRLRTAVGNDGINQQRASISDTFGPVSEQLSFARDFSTGFMPDRDYRNLNFASDTHIATSWGPSDLTAAYMDHPFGANDYYAPYPSWEDTKTWWIGGRQMLGKKTQFSFAWRRHSDLFVLFRDQPQIYANHHSDQSYQGALRRTESLARAITVSYGVEAVHESIVSNNLGVHARNRGAAYVAADFRALRRFSLNVSAREEIWRDLSATMTPTVSGGAWINSRFKFHTSASRAFRVPSYTELYYSDPTDIGNPNLRPESAWTYEAGADWQPTSRARADLTVFNRQVSNGIDYYRTDEAAPWQALNVDRLRFTGVESSLHFALSRTQTLDLHYDWLVGTQNTIPGTYTKYSFNYPADAGVAAYQATFHSRWMLRTRIGAINRRGLSPYALWDLYAAYSASKIHPYLQLSNLTNTAYQEIPGVPMPGRTIVGGVELLVKRK